ncbi:Maltose/maltodextrin ABC transporter, permease protein MalG [Cystobacter fuscus DSM 2262]|uniref:Maltose/maltodextrin ABC transporter, permease protein MalG n=1 Tax=Cystobacter fuscus (strain ATCC 25194 / DSM 2262 / NBRC 100088 / M29) TaxID=1242864 RepID=S9PH18_CYSF2|nr:carbohydrate ABC transporter permease [Cystobacter fuscus]EPX62386.1 Maltose/maltodextrin ABC transporter, permease protein MalG [Cystobacter fuscus DSM 2262]
MSQALVWLKRISFGVLVTAITVYTLFPYYWAVVSSLKEGSALFQVQWWPTKPAWHNYVAVFTEQPFGRNLLNSVLVASSVVIVSLILAITAAFALARIRFRGRVPLMLMILGVSMFPQIAVLSGMFELIRALGLYNKLSGLTLSYMLFTLPFTVWVLTTFMRELPKELEEAAVVDGATPWVVCMHVFLPLLRPALVTTGLLAFIAAWNEFLFALTFTLDQSARTVPVAIALMSGASQYESPWGLIMAASVIVTTPLIVLVLIFQRSIVSGLMAGAVKG